MDIVSLINAYGPYGFGLFVFLIVWKVVIEPSLVQLNTLGDTLNTVVMNQKEQDKTQQASIVVLQNIVNRLESLEKKYDQRKEEGKTH